MMDDEGRTMWGGGVMGNSSGNNNSIRTNNNVLAVEPSEEQIAQLTSMGFDRALVVEALRQTHNDAELATHILLSQYS